MVARPGAYPLTGPTTVMQIIAIAGGLSEWARSKEIRVVRVDQGKSTSLPFNYQDVARGKSLQQNIELKPGDTVVIP
jgi:polysaccharide export outer membrane protein